MLDEYEKKYSLAERRDETGISQLYKVLGELRDYRTKYHQSKLKLHCLRSN